jgi:ankyrin repeat protein
MPCYGADPNSFDHDGESALHAAVKRRNAPAIKELLAHSMSDGLHLPDRYGPTAIDIAAAGGTDATDSFFDELTELLRSTSQTDGTCAP